MSIILGPLGNRDFRTWLNTGARAGTVTSPIIGNLTSFTWEWWFRPSLAPSTSKILWRRYQNEIDPGDVRVSRDSSGRIVVIDPNHGEVTLTSTTVFAAGEWHHISLAYDSATGAVDLLIDAVVEDSGTKTTNPWSSHPLLQQPSGCALGEWADMRMWNFKRSSAQVSADYGAPLVGNESGLVAYWPGDGSGNSTPNTAGAGANMAQIGGGNWEWIFASQPKDLTAPSLDTTPSAAARVVSTSAPAVITSVTAAAYGNNVVAPALVTSVTAPESAG